MHAWQVNIKKIFKRKSSKQVPKVSLIKPTEKIITITPANASVFEPETPSVFCP